MNLEGEQIIAAPRAEVWRHLNDPETLKASVPGCEELTQTSPTSFTAVVVQKIGPVKARFTGAVELSNIVEAQSYTISGEGKGGPAGLAKGGADVSLEDAEDGGTNLTYSVQASVSGKIAQLGGRLINAFAKKMADQFFERFAAHVAGPVESEAVEPEVAVAETAPDAESEVTVAETAPGVEPEVAVADTAPDAEPEVAVADTAPDAEPEVAVADTAPDAEPEAVAAETVPDAEPEVAVAETAPEKPIPAVETAQTSTDSTDPAPKKGFWERLFG